MEDRELSKVILIHENEDEQQMVVNGQPMTRKIPHSVAICPNCKEVILDFGNALASHILKGMESMSIPLNYCPNCGQKLSKPCLFEAKNEGKDNG